MEDARKAELLERHLNNAAIYTSNENFEEAFAIYEQASNEAPEALAVWESWLNCCYQRIETNRCMFRNGDAFGVSLMRQLLDRVLALSDENGQARAQEKWNTFWINTADSAWAGEMSLISAPPSIYAYHSTFSTFADELSLVGEMHPHVAEVIAEGCHLASQLNDAGVCFWQVEHLTVGPRERVFQMERGIDTSRPVKGTCYDWFPSRPEFGSNLELVLGKMCLSRLKDTATNVDAASAQDAGLFVYLVRPIPMEDVKIKEFSQYATWRWNAMKTCPYCGAKLTGLFSRECGICHRDVKKLKKK